MGRPHHKERASQAYLCYRLELVQPQHLGLSFSAVIAVKSITEPGFLAFKSMPRVSWNTLVPQVQVGFGVRLSRHAELEWVGRTFFCRNGAQGCQSLCQPLFSTSCASLFLGTQRLPDPAHPWRTLDGAMSSWCCDFHVTIFIKDFWV